MIMYYHRVHHLIDKLFNTQHLTQTLAARAETATTHSSFMSNCVLMNNKSSYFTDPLQALLPLLYRNATC